MKKILLLFGAMFGAIFFLGCTTTHHRSPASNETIDAAAPYLGNPMIDVKHYHVKALVTEWPPKAVKFETQVQLSLTQAANEVDLLIESSVMSVQSVEFEKQNLVFQVVSGQGNSYGLSGSVLAIQLPRQMEAGKDLNITIRYSVTKTAWSDDKGIFYVTKDSNFGQDLLITRNWPYYARYWLPSNDSPEDVATIDYDFNVPKDLMAIANGRLVTGGDVNGSGLTPQGLRRFEWRQNVPTTTYNFVFAVGRFDVQKKNICFNIDGNIDDRYVQCAKAKNVIPSVVYYNKNNPNTAVLLSQVEKAMHSMVYYSKVLGLYAFEKIGFVQSPYPFAMESTSLIVLNKPALGVHEMVHHWWGNNVHIKHWGDFWISEGFTSYFTGLYDEYLSGTNTTCLQNPTADLNHIPQTDPNAIFDNTPYCKGAFAIYSLRARIAILANAHANSKKIFVDFMKDLFEKYKGKQLSSMELVSFIEQDFPRVFAQNGVQITPAQAQKFSQDWKKSWLIDVP